ncbi:hypothetical protein BDP55DRAFT_166558 [Colletotrichum godetiae]|uniref:Uncharacterized protein n=1 Tax=Colletotrichum godetiae TaxID=1209918 RepID=A0AAJ0ANN5_9PEZI|nr:uncharacterized protein BDP55DRAFT_166558 [Colletotrichum godetiae]KAK1675031.1 hypothetical protein BDP55DRAFT_166558 [Colletotrichum godetiae]
MPISCCPTSLIWLYSRNSLTCFATTAEASSNSLHAEMKVSKVIHCIFIALKSSFTEKTEMELFVVAYLFFFSSFIIIFDTDFVSSPIFCVVFACIYPDMPLWASFKYPELRNTESFV